MFLRQALAKAAEASLEVVHGDGGLLLDGVVLHFGDEGMCMVSGVCEGEDVRVALIVSMNSEAEAEGWLRRRACKGNQKSARDNHEGVYVVAAYQKLGGL